MKPDTTPPSIPYRTATSRGSDMLLLENLKTIAEKIEYCKNLIEENEHPLNCVEKGSDAWKFLRKFYLCGSEVAALLGVDDRMSRKAFMRSKEFDYVEPPMDAVSKRMTEYGQYGEKAAIEALSQMLPYDIQENNLNRTLEKLPFLQGTPDFVTTNCSGDLIPFEIKTRAYPNPFDAVPYMTISEVPIKHWIQLQVYMAILNAEEGYLISYTSMNGITFFNVRFNQVLWLEFIEPVILKWKNGQLNERVTFKERDPLLDFIHYNVYKQRVDVFEMCDNMKKIKK